MPSPFIKYIQYEQHYTEVISRVAIVKLSCGLGRLTSKTADERMFVLIG